jgi:voltage-gated potassium channel
MILWVRFIMQRMLRSPPRLMRVCLLLASILLYGASGFLYFELPGNPDLTWGDGFWYTIVTMATVGYGDLFPKTWGGRFFVGVPIMVIGIGLLGYTLSLVAASLIEAKTREIRGMASFRLHRHLVIFNFPGVSKVTQVIEELFQDPAFGSNRQVVIIDEDLAELPGEIAGRQVHFVRGNPTRDETLARAAIDQASHAVVLSRKPGDPASDSLNVAIALAIEGRNKEVKTVVECVEPAAEELLRKTGCDQIVCADRYDAYFITQELLNPGTQGVIGELLSARDGCGSQQLFFTPVTAGSPQRFAAVAQHCRQHGHLPLGIQHLAENCLNPADDFPVENGDRAITIGHSRLPPLNL